MKILCRKKIAIYSRKDAILIPVYKNIRSLRHITGKKIDDELHHIIQSDYFNFEDKEIKSFYMEINQKLKKVYLLHAPREQDEPRIYMELGAKLAKILMKDQIESFSMVSFEDIYNEKKNFSSTKAFIEGFMFGEYSDDRYKSKKNNFAPNELEIITAQQKLKNFIDENTDIWNTVFENVNLVRNLVNAPANYLTPDIFCKLALENLPKNITARYLDEKQLLDEGYNLIYSVGKGAVNKPRFLILNYQGNPESKTNIALVGKGVTFDSGGSNLKPTGSIECMKLDMAGGATVYATIRLTAMLNLKCNINAYIPLVENIIGGDAIRPGDIIKSASGKTIEVMNTDAEGRLILADACFAATKTDPELIIDLATLTGACVVALGPYCAGLFSNRKFLSKQMLDISSEVSEDVWELPLYNDYEKGIESDLADLQNMSSFKREGGAIHAALFLKQFIDNYPWIHLDIAGPAYIEKAHPIFGKLGTGFGVRLLYKFIKTHYNGENNV